MINKIINESYLHPAQKHQKLKWKGVVCYVMIFAIVLVLFGQNMSLKENLNNCSKCHNRHDAMSRYFERSGNKHPELMAEAVLATKKPKLMAAVAVKGERNTPYTVKNGGYKKRHVGAWQVNEKYWGFAGNTPLQQALKAEAILDELIVASGGNLKKALNAYGGDKTKKVYARNILAEIENIP